MPPSLLPLKRVARIGKWAAVKAQDWMYFETTCTSTSLHVERGLTLYVNLSTTFLDQHRILSISDTRHFYFTGCTMADNDKYQLRPFRQSGSHAPPHLPRQEPPVEQQPSPLPDDYRHPRIDVIDRSHLCPSAPIPSQRPDHWHLQRAESDGLDGRNPETAPALPTMDGLQPAPQPQTGAP